MWLHRFFDPKAFFWDILNPDSPKTVPEDDYLSEYKTSRLLLYPQVRSHPSNLMFLRPVVHREFFDNFRMTINPFTFRKFLCHLPGLEWSDDLWYKDQFDSLLRAPFSDRRTATYLAPPEDNFTPSYPSRLALLVHFRSALRYHCSWDLGNFDQETPADIPRYEPPIDAFQLVSYRPRPPNERGREAARGRRGLSVRRGGGGR